MVDLDAALVRDLKERNICTKKRPLATGGIRGGIPFERGALFYPLRNRFYIGEVRYKGEVLPGAQPPIMERALFDASSRSSRINGPLGTVSGTQATTY